MANFSAGTASVEISPDFRNFVRDLRNDLDRVEAELGVEIKPDIAGFTRELENELKTVNAEVGVEVKPDETSLSNLERVIQARIDLMNLSVDVKVGADTRTAADDLAALHAAYRNMTMDVDADTTAAAAQIAGLNAIPVRANVQADRGSLLSSLGGPLMLNVGAVGAAQLPAMGAAVASIGVSVQQLTQSAALLPGIFAAAGAGIATLSVGLDGMKDAFAEGEKGAKAYAELSREGKALVDTAKSFGSEWDRIKGAVQSTTLDGLAVPLDGLLTAQLPALERGMTGLAGVFNAGFSTMLTELGSAESVGALESVFSDTSNAAGVLNGAITPIISSVRTLATTGATFLPELAQGFTNAATRLDAFLTRSSESGDLTRWMQEGIDAGGRLISVIGNIGSSLASILRAAKTDGDGFLGTLDDMTERWSTWLGSAEGQGELRTFFIQGREQLEGWRTALEGTGSVFGTVLESAQTWGAVMAPVLRATAELLNDHEGILKTLLVSYFAFRTVGPIFNLLGTAISGATTRLHAFNAAQTAASGAGASGMRSALSGLGAMLGGGGVFGFALLGATVGLGLLATKHQEAKQAAAEQQAQLEALGQTLDETTGKATQATLDTRAADLGKGGYLTRAETLGVSPDAYVRAAAGVDAEAQAQINQRITGIILEQQDSARVEWGRAKQSGLSDEEIAQALQGLPEAVAKYKEGIEAAQIELAKMGSEEKLPDLTMLKDALNDIGESAATLGGEMNQSAAQTAQLGEQTRQATDAAQGMWSLTEEGRAAFDGLGVAVDKVSANTVALRGATAEQQQAMRDLGYTVQELPDKTVVVTLNDDQARAQVVKLNTEAAAPVTKTVNIVYTGDFLKPEGARQTIPGRAEGGEINGGIPGRDSVPIMAMPGEHMLTTSDVDRLGGQAGVYRFRAALQAGLVRPMAGGGAIMPQAELPGQQSDDQLDLLDAEYRIDQANTKRNQIYADPASTDEEKAAADRDYIRAQNARQALIEQQRQSTGSTSATGSELDVSLPGIAAKGAGILAEGILGMFGLENSILSGGNVYTRSLNTALGFYAGKAQEGAQAEQPATSYDYTPKNLPVDQSDDTSSSAAGESSGAHTYDANGGVEQWRPTFTSVLRALSMPLGWLELGLAQMASESGGNPQAINQWDSNAAAGIPSKGLMQVIDPTFAAHRSSLYPADIWDPEANIAAALRYTVSRYETPVGVWGEGHGYRDGGWVFGIGGPRDDANRARLSNGEFVVNAAAAAAHAPMLEAINAGLPTATRGLPAGMRPRGGDTTINNRDHGLHFNAPITVADPSEFIREADRFSALQAQGAMAGLH